jgi:hypothetical protein
MWTWIATVFGICTLLAVDMVVHRFAQLDGLRHALVASGHWVGVSLTFGVLVMLAAAGASLLHDRRVGTGPPGQTRTR